MVTTNKDERMKDVLPSIDVVQGETMHLLKPATREIVFVIDKIEKSGKKPTFSEIARGIYDDASQEVARQPLVKASETVTRFGNKLIQVEEKADGSKTARISGNELFRQLYGLVEAGYIAVLDEGEGEGRKLFFKLTSKAKDHLEKLVFKLTPEAKDQIEKFDKAAGRV